MAADDDGDIEGWLSNLSARRGQSTARPGKEEQALRKAILNRAGAQQTGQDSKTDDPAWQRMRFRLRRERLVPPHRPRWGLWLSSAAVATLALTVAVVPRLQKTTDPALRIVEDEPPMLRGTAPATVLVAASPLENARRVAGITARLDGKPVVYLQAGIATVDFELDIAALPAAELEIKRAFPQANIKAGFNRLVFSDRP